MWESFRYWANGVANHTQSQHIFGHSCIPVSLPHNRIPSDGIELLETIQVELASPRNPAFLLPLSPSSTLAYPTAPDQSACMVLDFTHNIKDYRYRFYLVTDLILLLPLKDFAAHFINSKAKGHSRHTCIWLPVLPAPGKPHKLINLHFLICKMRLKHFLSKIAMKIKWGSMLNGLAFGR